MESKNINKSISVYENNNYDEIKGYQRFAFVYDLIKDYLVTGASFLDIGCAKGEFIYYLKDKGYLDIHYTGLEYASTLIEIAQKERLLQNVNFIKGDAQNFNLGKEFDIVHLAGVLSIFDDISDVLMRMIDHIKVGGYGIIFGGFTEDNIDVLVRYRNNKTGSPDWESGWNMFSILTVERLIKDRVDNFNVEKFSFNGELKRDRNNPVASYSIKTDQDDTLLLTGGNIVRDFYLIKFRRCI